MSVFALQGKTRDGVTVLLGGICGAGTAGVEAALRQALSGAVFAPCDDPYLTDVKLHRVVTEAAESCKETLEAVGVTVLAAVTPSPATEACGAVLGAPFSPAESADGALEQLGNGYYAVCRPGEFGVAYAATDLQAAQRIYRQITAASMEETVRILKHTEFMLACDSSAGRTGGLLFGDGLSVRCRMLPGDEEERGTR